MLQNPNVETISNHLTSGGVTTLSGALNPDEPLSFDHWMSSLGVAITVYGGYKMVTAAKGAVRVQPKPSVASSAGDVLAKPPGAAGSVADDVLDRKPAGTIESKIDNVLEAGLHVNEPQKYLDRALKNQGINSVPNRMKETWIEDGFKYEVRIHEANPIYGKTGSIYRVSRQKTKVSANGQGSGTEYLGADGIWYHTSILKTQNPLYDANAAEKTHIQVPR